MVAIGAVAIGAPEVRCVPATDFSVAKARAWRSSIDAEPAYQRSGDVWSPGQRRRLIDSLLNGFDVPKIYLHDLRGIDPRRVYAVVDGKQRLTAIWDYLEDAFGLAPDFVLEGGASQSDRAAPGAPAPGRRFSELAPRWRDALLWTPLAVVLIQDATEIDIEELFSRLNNGVPLTPAERRHAIGGDVMKVVREIAASPALAALLEFPDVRGAHAEVAVRLVGRVAARLGIGEATDAPGGIDDSGDPSAAALEILARRGRVLPPGAARALLDGTDELLMRVSTATAAADRRDRGAAARRSDPDAAWAEIRPIIDGEPPIRLRRDGERAPRARAGLRLVVGGSGEPDRAAPVAPIATTQEGDA